jgi:SAM-dependent methyltransferase
MKRFLLPHLICPACLPHERSLTVTIDRENGDDIVTGRLVCPGCRQRYPIRDGIAILTTEPDSGPAGGQWRYEEPGMVESYLWSHFGDLAGCADSGSAVTELAGCLAPATVSLDAGCAVGRLAFEMAARGGFAVGCDLSHSFIKVARRLAGERSASFSLPLEGNLRETFHCRLPEAWPTERVEFVVADALRLPFAGGSFTQVASLNLLDRVSYPLAHLYEMNRVAADCNSAFLFADPFSWTTTAAPAERWLGGTTSGDYPGRGQDNVRRLLTGDRKVLTPPWRIAREGTVAWRMRSHCNHYEVITSQFLLAAR